MKRTHSLVVGGTRGIGRAIARNFLSQGHLVSVIGRHASTGIDQEDAKIRHWLFDVVDSEQLKQAWGEITEWGDGVNNIVFAQRFRGEGDQWSGEIETELTATNNLIELLALHPSQSEGVSVVILSSVASTLIATEQPVGYHVAKAALGQMVRYYAVALGPKGIRVNCVSSGPVVKDESKEFYESNPRLTEMNQSIIPIGRMTTSEDIANSVAFLCSDKASAINGHTINVDGGLSLLWQESLGRRLAGLDHIETTQRPKT